MVCCLFSAVGMGALYQNGLTSLQLNAIHVLHKVQMIKQQTCWTFTSQNAMQMSYKYTERSTNKRT